MEVQEKNTVYQKDQLNNLDSEQLKGILDKRNVEYHHMNKDETLIAKIIETNPVDESFGDVPTISIDIGRRNLL